jgi:hypothetical protein
VHVFSRHTTAAVRIQETSHGCSRTCAGSWRDWPRQTATTATTTFGCAPSTCIRTNGPTGVRTVQRLFLVELNGPRPQRELLVQVLGEAEPAPADWSRPVAQVGQPRFDLAVVS